MDASFQVHVPDHQTAGRRSVSIQAPVGFREFWWLMVDSVNDL
jgi:hypothetical protein